MTDKKLKELEDCTKTYELIQPNAHVTKMLRLALDEINSLRNKVDSLTPKEENIRVKKGNCYYLRTIGGELMQKVYKDIQVGYATIKDFNIVGITSYEEDSKGLTVKYLDGSSVKINGSTSAIEVLKIICDTSIENRVLGNCVKDDATIAKVAKALMSD